jgi:hypothetical protein
MDSANDFAAALNTCEMCGELEAAPLLLMDGGRWGKPVRRQCLMLSFATRSGSAVGEEWALAWRRLLGRPVGRRLSWEALGPFCPQRSPLLMWEKM